MMRAESIPRDSRRLDMRSVLPGGSRGPGGAGATAWQSDLRRKAVDLHDRRAAGAPLGVAETECCHPDACVGKGLPRRFFVGIKDMLPSHDTRNVSLPEETFRDFKQTDPFLPQSLGPLAEWIHVGKTGAPREREGRKRRGTGALDRSRTA
jgi:hypothetical protein